MSDQQYALSGSSDWCSKSDEEKRRTLRQAFPSLTGERLEAAIARCDAFFCDTEIIDLDDVHLWRAV